MTIVQDDVFSNLKNPQVIDDRGVIVVSRPAKFVRLLLIIVTTGLFLYGLNYALTTKDALVITSAIFPVSSIILLIFAWVLYRSPTTKQALGNELVSIIVPVYNQEQMLSSVLDAIFRSTYKHLEVIVVNDGSKDKTREIVNHYVESYPNLKMIDKFNAGKRKAIGDAFSISKGKYIVLIDSDSVIEEHAIENMVRAFNSDKRIGGVVGNVKAWNANVGILTKFQSVWYDISFNIKKAYETYYGLTQCLSGCMAGYRREALKDFIPVWIDALRRLSDDRQLTTLIHAKPWAKKELLFRYANRRLASATKYDDAEDRVLTAQTMIQWRTVYVASAVVFTDVPETFRSFLKQQIRWRRGYLRVQLFVSAFMWHNNPIAAFMFYHEFMTILLMPLALFTVFVYQPLIHGEYWFTLYFVSIHFIIAFFEGLDTRFRNRGDKHWKYRPLMQVVFDWINAFAVIYAALTLKENKWGTR